MAKVDVSVTRSLTINTGSYESIKPTVTLTARDIEANQADDAYLLVSEIIDNLIKMEILASTAEAREVSRGLQEYCRNVAANTAEIGQKVEESLNKLNEL